MTDFLKNYQHSKLYADLSAAVQEQYKKGVISEDEIKKFIALVKNETKLKTALKFL